MPFWGPKCPPDCQYSKISHLGGAQKCHWEPPDAPKASWTAYTAADCTLPPGTLGTTLVGSAPAPGPGETTFTYYFLPLSLYLLASNMWFLVDPHATSLVPRGRRIRKGCALCRRPRKKTTSHSNSNFNQVNIEIPSFSTHHFQI